MKNERGPNPEVDASASLRLPLPRLQLTWVKGEGRQWRCRYDLLIPVDDMDVRNRGDCCFAIAEFGATIVTPGRDGWSPIHADGSIETPFRDGSHAAWDSNRLSGLAMAIILKFCPTRLGWQKHSVHTSPVGKVATLDNSSMTLDI